jgi:hypothetical protein
MHDPDLRLELRSGSIQLLPGTAGLAAMLASLARDPAARAALETASGISLAPLLPAKQEDEPEPDWLRAEEMLDAAAACPSERLLASSLATVTAWWQPAQLQAAAQQLAAVLSARADGHLATQCRAVARVVGVVPPTERVRLTV